MDTIMRVRWCRARFVPGEVVIEDCRNEQYDEFEDVGYLISEDVDKVVLAHQKVAQGCYADLIVIPSKAIVNTANLVDSK